MSEVKSDKLSPRTDSGTTTLGDSGDTFLVNTGAKIDINGTELILDADADTSITADTDDQIDIRIAGADDFQFTANKFLVQTGSNIDMNGTELILDADADTSITADTDDQIDIKIAGADDFRFTANNMNVLSGSTLTVDSGATIANSGTATGFDVTDKPFVSVYRSVYTANVTGNGTDYTVTWDTELADTGNDFATPTFTAPSTGFYRVDLFLLLFSLTSAATSARIRLVATGSTYNIYYLSGVPTDVTTVPFSGSNVIKMTAADTFHIDVRVAGESSDVVELDGLKTFSGMTIEFLGNV